MNVKNIEKEKNSAKIVVEIEKQEFQTALDKAYNKCKKDIAVPGFRKGKAPRKIVESMYGEKVFFEDGVNEIFPSLDRIPAPEAGTKFALERGNFVLVFPDEGHLPGVGDPASHVVKAVVKIAVE